jgi:hypothetical protein
MYYVALSLSASGYALLTLMYLRDGLYWSALLFLLYALSIPVIWMSARA